MPETPPPNDGFLILTCALIVALGAWLIALGLENLASGETTKRPLVCFPADRWGPAPDRDRPCVWRLYEDGSVVVKQRDGGRLPDGR